MTRKPLKGPFPLMPFVVHANGELDLEGLKHNIGLYEQAGVPGSYLGMYGVAPSTFNQPAPAPCCGGPPEHWPAFTHEASSCRRFWSPTAMDAPHSRRTIGLSEV